jgi:hypothetical protein
VDAQARRALPAASAGALHLSRTNAFFMGGGKALVNAYYRSAEQLACEVRYDTPVDRLDSATAISSPPCRQANASRPSSCVLAAGGFESNREWLREAWGQNERGEWPADNFLIRGTRFNRAPAALHDRRGRRLHRRPDAIAHAWRSTRARRSTTAASARVSTACRSAWW